MYLRVLVQFAVLLRSFFSSFAQDIQQGNCSCSSNEEVILGSLWASQTIRSPGYPHPYCSNLECGWLVIGPANSIIQLTWNDVWIEYFDDIIAYDGRTRNYRQLTDCTEDLVVEDGEVVMTNCDNVCGTRTEMLLEFITDNSKELSGFELIVTAVPPGTCACNSNEHIDLKMLGETIVINSPGYPNGYYNNLKCGWAVSGPIGSFLEIKFNDFDIGECNDRLLVFDGPVTDQSDLLVKCLGGTVCYEATSTSSVIFIKFITDEEVQRPGFQVGITAVADAFQCSECGVNEEILIDAVGKTITVTSPGYPKNYCNNLICGWTVRGPANSFLQIRWNDIQIADADTVFVLDGTLDSDLLTGCDYQANECENSTSTSEVIYVAFMTDTFNQMAGFELTVTAEECSSPCNSNETIVLDSYEANHTIKSPGYPNVYCNNLKCGWTVRGPENSFIQIIWDHVDIERDHDKIVVFDGPTANSTLIVECSASSCGSALSTSSMIFIEFVTDKKGQRQGFEAKVIIIEKNLETTTTTTTRTTISQVDTTTATTADDQTTTITETCSTPCNSTEDIILNPGDSHTIQSPGYPQSYCNNLQCGWNVTGPVNSILQIIWNGINIAEFSDQVVIYDGGTSDSRILVECTGTACDDVMTTGNGVFIEFTTDDREQGTGFEIVVTTRGVAGLPVHKMGRKVSANILVCAWSCWMLYVFKKLLE